MTTINSNRITGLATGMDIDEMVTNMLTNEKNKIDKAEQKKNKLKFGNKKFIEMLLLMLRDFMINILQQHLQTIF